MALADSLKAFSFHRHLDIFQVTEHLGYPAPFVKVGPSFGFPLFPLFLLLLLEPFGHYAHLISSPGPSAPRLSSIVNAVKHRHHAAMSLGSRTCSW